MKPAKTNIHVERLALDGDGIGHLKTSGADSGQAAFVPYSLPDELIDARLLVQKKNHSRWLPAAITKPSPDRNTPPCPYHFKAGQMTPWCGGCDWQHIKIPAQRISKKQLVIETLERLGGVANPPVADIIASPQDWRYRNKVQVPFGRGKKGVVAGFFAPQSHEIVDFDDCLIQSELSVALVQFVKTYANVAKWIPYDEDRHRGWIRHLLVRTNEAAQAMVTVITANEDFHDRDRFVREMRSRFPSVIGIHQNVQKARTNVIVGPIGRKLWGADYIDESVLGLKISCSPGSFFQVNKPSADLLYQKAIDELGTGPSKVVLDIYCGVGALTLALAKRSSFVIGIEAAASSIANAQFNARQNRIANVEFIEGFAERVLSRPVEGLRGVAPADLLVLVDPPRSGCAPEVLQTILNLKPARIVYVSCHPGTLARDVKILSADYRVVSATPVDLFPQTSHIETVCRLDRK